MIIKNNTNIPANSTIYNAKGDLFPGSVGYINEKHFIGISNTFMYAFPFWTAYLSNNMVHVKPTIVQSSRTLTRASYYGPNTEVGFHYAPWDVTEDLDQFVPDGADYDCVFVYGHMPSVIDGSILSSNGAVSWRDGIPGRTRYYGFGTLHSLNITDYSINSFRAELMVHELLHQLDFYYRLKSGKGVVAPVCGDNPIHCVWKPLPGYCKDPKFGDKRFYHDYLMGTVKNAENGNNTGLGMKAWQHRTIRGRNASDIVLPVPQPGPLNPGERPWTFADMTVCQGEYGSPSTTTTTTSSPAASPPPPSVITKTAPPPQTVSSTTIDSNVGSTDRSATTSTSSAYSSEALNASSPPDGSPPSVEFSPPDGSAPSDAFSPPDGSSYTPPSAQDVLEESDITGSGGSDLSLRREPPPLINADPLLAPTQFGVIT